MPAFTVLIKPASGDCNLHCRYCFYRDEIQRREICSFGRMSVETLENIVRKAMAYGEGSCTFGFQGGEPTLAGLDFYRNYIALVRRYARPRLEVHHFIQTNGSTLTEEWARFFHDNHFLVGISIDGPAQCHDAVRPDGKGCGSFQKVWAGKALLEKYRVEFNVLTVVTEESARQVDRIYEFFRENHLYYQQYIPCLAPLDAEGQGTYAIKAETYGQFLCRLFDLWYRDQLEGKPVYIRYFDNLAGMLLGYPPENCGLCGRCTNQFVVEANGNVYPCDFYVLDEYLLGNFNTDSIPRMIRKEEQIGFVRASVPPDPECKGCSLFWICRGGCRRDRQRKELGHLGKSCFCRAYQMFFPHMLPKMEHLFRRLRG